MYGLFGEMDVIEKLLKSRINCKCPKDHKISENCNLNKRLQWRKKRERER